MEPGEQRSTKDEESESESGQEGDSRGPASGLAPQQAEAAAEKVTPERVDWTAMLEERALVPDSEQANPVAVPEVPAGPPRRRGLHLLVAVVALFSVVASAAVVIALWRGSAGDEPEEPAASGPRQGATPAAPANPAPTSGAASAAAAAAAETGAPAQPGTPPPAPPVTSTTPPVDPATAPSEAATPSAESSAERPRRSSSRDRSSEKPRSRSKSDRKKSASAETGSKATASKESGSTKGKNDEVAESRPPADPNLPVEPSVKDLASAVDKVKSRIETCAKENGVSGLAALRAQIEPSGAIAWVAIREGGSAFHTCVGRVVREIRLPASQRGGTLVHSVTLPDP